MGPIKETTRSHLFTAFERTRMKDGQIALWTQEDNVTRFDRIEVRVLAPTQLR
jgi:hypothetical protein